MDGDLTARNWSHLQELLFAKSWSEKLGLYRSNYVFRGLHDRAFNLKTSLMRLGGSFKRLEKHLLRNFRKYAHRDLVESDDQWHWLALAQHHGLPTRLMDWTYSPFVALHFATSGPGAFDHDAAIWCVNYVEVHKLLPSKLLRILKREGSNIFTVEMLGKYCGHLTEFDQVKPRRSHGPCLLFLEPPSLDDRVVNQFAVFSAMSSSTAHLDEWLDNHRSLWQRVILPKGLKREVRDKLDQGNITERVLFPGLDGLCYWLTRYYSPATGGIAPGFHDPILRRSRKQISSRKLR